MSDPLRPPTLRPLAVDAEKLALGEMVGGEPAGLADHGVGNPQAVVEIGGRRARQVAAFPAGAVDEPRDEGHVVAGDQIDQTICDPFHDTGTRSRPPRQYSASASCRGRLSRLESPASCSAFASSGWNMSSSIETELAPHALSTATMST